MGGIYLDKATLEVGAEWTDSGQRSEERGLKHREETVRRPVPCCPEPALILHEHIASFGIAPDGRLFVAERGGRISSSSKRRWEAPASLIWDADFLGTYSVQASGTVGFSRTCRTTHNTPVTCLR